MSSFSKRGEMKTIEVVAAIIIDDGKVFCTQRSNSGEVALKWEFPGGKVETGESHQTALAREILEELSCRIEVGAFFQEINHQYKTFKLKMFCYLCTIHSGEMRLTEHVDSCWLPINKLDTLDWAPADWPVIYKLMK